MTIIKDPREWPVEQLRELALKAQDPDLTITAQSDYRQQLAELVQALTEPEKPAQTTIGHISSQPELDVGTDYGKVIVFGYELSVPADTTELLILLGQAIAQAAAWKEQLCHR